jgi:hypothetical protein
VPNPHAIFYDVGLNWIIAPIMTEDEMKNWNGEPYPVAIVAGECVERTMDDAIDLNNLFQDGIKNETAEEAEASLLGRLKVDEIVVCSTDDLVKVTDRIRSAMEGIADLHVRTRNGDGTPQENVPSRNVGIVDLLPSICSSMGLSSEATLTDMGTVYEKSKQGLEMSIQRLIQNGGGIRVPKHPSKNSFCGKTVFKTMIKEKKSAGPYFGCYQGWQHSKQTMGRQATSRMFSQVWRWIRRLPPLTSVELKLISWFLRLLERPEK